MTTRRLVLASTSPFRRELLGRLGLPFEVAAPEIDESQLPGESPEALVLRLSEAKARAVAEQLASTSPPPDTSFRRKPESRKDSNPDPSPGPQHSGMTLLRGDGAPTGARAIDSLVIGSDQVAVIDDEVLGKPGDRERAIAQLTRASGRRVTFLTGLSLVDAASGRAHTCWEPFHVHFRTLSADQIARYVDREQPFNCAGSFKSEGYGITLFERLEGNDPNALIGLPLIRLVELLSREGIDLP